MSRHRLSNSAIYKRVKNTMASLETDIEFLILSTPTSPVREKLTEANILMAESKERFAQAMRQFHKDMGLA